MRRVQDTWEICCWALPGGTCRIPVVVSEGSSRWENVERDLPLNDGFVVVRPGGDLKVAIPYCHALEPCVLLADAEALDAEADGGYRQAVQDQRIRILAVTSTAEPDQMQRLLLFGAMGFISRDRLGAELKRAVTSIWAGEIWASRLVLSNAFRTCLPSLDNRLTNRERQLMQLLEKGLTNREVAGHLGISRETVRWHARRLYSKVGTVKRQGPARRALGQESPRAARNGTSG